MVSMALFGCEGGFACLCIVVMSCQMWFAVQGGDSSMSFRLRTRFLGLWNFFGGVM